MQRRPLIIPAITIAADPIIGTWKLDVGNSKFFLPLPRKTEVCRELASGEVEIVLTRVQSPDAVRLMPGIASCCRAGGPFRIASDLTLTPIDVHTLFSANRDGVANADDSLVTNL